MSTGSPVTTSSAVSTPVSERAAALQTWADTQLETLRIQPSTKARDMMVPYFRKEYGRLVEEHLPLPSYLLTPEAFQHAVEQLAPHS